MTPVEYLNLIERKYEEAKAKNLSRFNPEWGMWSRQMNIELWTRVQESDPESPALKHVFMFWISRSKLLEMHFNKKSWFGMIKRLQEFRHGERLKEIILSRKLPEIRETFGQLARRILS